MRACKNVPTRHAHGQTLTEFVESERGFVLSNVPKISFAGGCKTLN
jgi:hypothetical protein